MGCKSRRRSYHKLIRITVAVPKATFHITVTSSDGHVTLRLVILVRTKSHVFLSISSSRVRFDRKKQFSSSSIRGWAAVVVRSTIQKHQPTAWPISCACCSISTGLTSTVNTIPLMVEDDLLTKVYSQERNECCYIQITAYCVEFGRQNPALKVLEIGGGNAFASLQILQAARR